MSSSAGKKRISGGGGGGGRGDAGILARINRSLSESAVVGKAREAAGDAGYVAKRLAKSTGKAAWIAGTTFLVLVVPLIIEMDREQQFTELELQQQSLLGPPPPTPLK